MTDEQKQKQPEAKSEAKQPEAKSAAKQPEAKSAHTVAEGCTIACKKGVLSPGDEVRAEYLGGGQKALDVLVKAGKVDSSK